MPMRKLHFRVSEKTYHQLKEEARKRGYPSLSFMIRVALKKYVSKNLLF